jgi:hypothetical protein
MDCLGDAEVILFGLEGHFFGQKEWFKTILGPVSCFFCCYYGWLQWSDPERRLFQGNISPRGDDQTDKGG